MSELRKGPHYSAYPAFEDEEPTWPVPERRRNAWEGLGTFLFGVGVGMVAIAVAASLLILVLV